jgi:enoyl-CoA hydratase/carnithine racemase
VTNVVTVNFPSDSVAVVTMTNPAIANFGSWQAIGELADGLLEARQMGARVTIVASGVKGHWLEHAWLTDLHNTFAGGPTSGDGGAWWRCLDELTSTSVVTIAAVSGDTSGGGCELGWACDLRIADEQALFSQPEVAIGVGTGIGGTSRLRHLIGRSATAEMVLLGAPMTAQRLFELGAVNRVVPHGSALDVAVEWAERIVSFSAAAVTGMKRMLTEGDDLLRISESVANDQRIFRAFSGSTEALESMRRIQGRFDVGATPRDVYGDPIP